MNTAEQNVCNLLRQTWLSIITLLENLQDVPKQLLDRIRNLMNKLKNLILETIRDHLQMIIDFIERFLALRAIDQNKARQSFCSTLYACLPAVKKLNEYGILSDDVYNKLFGPTLITVDDLEPLGIQTLTFHSNFEAFEYIACRLSLTSLLNSFMDEMINKLFDYLSQFEKFFDLDYWLQNTFIGRQILTLVALYETAFETILKIINDELDPFLDCAFAMCDFAISSQNFLDDFSTRFKLERESTPDLGTTLRGPWAVSRDKMFSEFESSISDSKAIFTRIQNDAERVKTNVQQLNVSKASSNSTSYFGNDSAEYRRDVLVETA